MKSFFFYLALIILFLAGTRLVNRQQHYMRSTQPPAQSVAFASLLTANEPIRLPWHLVSQLTVNAPRSTATTSSHRPKLALAESANHKK